MRIGRRTCLAFQLLNCDTLRIFFADLDSWSMYEVNFPKYVNAAVQFFSRISICFSISHFLGYWKPNWLSSQLGNLTRRESALNLGLDWLSVTTQPFWTKDYYQFGQLRIEIWTSTFSKSEKYILQFETNKYFEKCLFKSNRNRVLLLTHQSIIIWCERFHAYRKNTKFQ